MSYLNVTNVSHTFGGRQILEMFLLNYCAASMLVSSVLMAKANQPSSI